MFRDFIGRIVRLGERIAIHNRIVVSAATGLRRDHPGIVPQCDLVHDANKRLVPVVSVMIMFLLPQQRCFLDYLVIAFTIRSMAISSCSEARLLIWYTGKVEGESQLGDIDVDKRNGLDAAIPQECLGS